MTKREVFQKYGRGPVQKRASNSFGAALDVYQATVEQLAQHTPYGDSPDFLDLGAPHWLPVCDDRQRLERSTGKSLRPGGQLRALNRFREFGASEDLPTPCYLNQLDAVTLGFVLPSQLIQCKEDAGWGCIRIECNELVRQGRPATRYERGLKQLR